MALDGLDVKKHVAAMPDPSKEFIASRSNDRRSQHASTAPFDLQMEEEGISAPVDGINNATQTTRALDLFISLGATTRTNSLL